MSSITNTRKPQKWWKFLAYCQTVFNPKWWARYFLRGTANGDRLSKSLWIILWFSASKKEAVSISFSILTSSWKLRRKWVRTKKSNITKEYANKWSEKSERFMSTSAHFLSTVKELRKFFCFRRITTRPFCWESSVLLDRDTLSENFTKMYSR